MMLIEQNRQIFGRESSEEYCIDKMPLQIMNVKVQ